MSIETLLAANIKAVEANTEALVSFAAAVGAAVAATPKAAAKTKTAPVTTAADAPATSAAPAGAAVSAAGATTTTTTAATPGPAIDANHPFSKAVTAFAKAHGRDAAVNAINKFGGEGRASNVKEVDRDAAHKYVLAEHSRLDAAKVAAAAALAASKPAGEESLI